jgi:peptidoglycan/LPS O-acetylase OafA/YrhL
MVQVWNPSRLLRINLPSWSLCGEVFFYACFPLLGVLLWKLRGAWLWVAALTLYVGGQTLVWVMRRHLSLEMTLTLPPLHLSTFALGILMARGQTLQQKRNGKAPVRVSQVSTVLGCRSALFGGVHCWSPFLVYRLPTTTG